MARSRVGAFDIVTDVGTPHIPGATSYDDDRQTFTRSEERRGGKDC